MMRFLQASHVLLAAFLVVAGCSGTKGLSDHDFTGTRVAAVAAIPPYPSVLLGTNNEEAGIEPVGALFHGIGGMIRQDKAEQAQTRLDSAYLYVDVAERIAEAVLSKNAPPLGYHPVPAPEAADYYFDIRIADYGLHHPSPGTRLRFILEAEVFLVDTHTDRRVWKRRLFIDEPVSEERSWKRPLKAFLDAYTARDLSRLTVEDLIALLEDMAAYTADLISSALRYDVERG